MEVNLTKGDRVREKEMTHGPRLVWVPKITIEHFCLRIHKNLLKQLKYAWVWGQSVKHQPQKVGKDHVLMDEDIVQFVKKA